jgi:hypothetical protein
MKIAGLALASMLLVGMAWAGTASAALLWLVCLKGTNSALTKYSDKKCSENPISLSTAEGWQSLGVPAGTKITVRILNFTVNLRDTATLIKSEVICLDGPASEGEGVIEAEGKGQITKAKINNASTQCAAVKKCTAVEAVEGRNLPWNIKLFEGTEKKLLTAIENSGAGEPGWKVRCKVGNEVQEDECTSESTEKLELAELISERDVLSAELLVRSRFESARKGKCSLSGKGDGEVVGLVAILLPEGSLSTHST